MSKEWNVMIREDFVWALCIGRQWEAHHIIWEAQMLFRSWHITRSVMNATKAMAHTIHQNNKNIVFTERPEYNIHIIIIMKFIILCIHSDRYITDGWVQWQSSVVRLCGNSSATVRWVLWHWTRLLIKQLSQHLSRVYQNPIKTLDFQ